MGIFQEVGLTWDGQEYVVPSEKVMGLVATIEDIVTLEELVSNGVKRAKLASAFCAALRYAGCRVDEEEVYASLFGDTGVTTRATIDAILSIMIPPESVQKLMPPAKKPAAPAKKPAVAGSRKRT